MNWTQGRILFPILLAVCLVGCGFKNPREDQKVYLAEPAGIHWRTNPRIEYYLNREASDLTEVVVRETFDRWSEAIHFEFVYKGRNRAGPSLLRGS